MGYQQFLPQQQSSLDGYRGQSGGMAKRRWVFSCSILFFILSVGPKHILPCRTDFFRALFGPVWEIGGLHEKQTTQPAVGHT